MARTLKDVALELLALYQDAETSVIWEYSGSIEEDTQKLSDKCYAYRKEIERLSNG